MTLALDPIAVGMKPAPVSRQMYDDMIRKGVLRPEHKVELINGQLIAKMSIGSKHARMVNALVYLLIAKLGTRAAVSIQNPVALHEYSEPEPDVAICRPPLSAYEDRHPEPQDILFLIEVADSSLQADLEGKVPLYAACDVPECWVVDVTERALYVFTQPDGTSYKTQAIYRPGDTVPLAQFPGCSLALSELGW